MWMLGADHNFSASTLTSGPSLQPHVCVLRIRVRLHVCIVCILPTEPSPQPSFHFKYILEDFMHFMISHLSLIPLSSQLVPFYFHFFCDPVSFQGCLQAHMDLISVYSEENISPVQILMINLSSGRAGHHEFSPFPDRMLKTPSCGDFLWRSCVGSHSCCEFKSITMPIFHLPTLLPHIIFFCLLPPRCSVRIGWVLQMSHSWYPTVACSQYVEQ